jgi:hypothetical protein
MQFLQQTFDARVLLGGQTIVRASGTLSTTVSLHGRKKMSQARQSLRYSGDEPHR